MALTTAALTDALDRLSRLATVVLNEHLNTDGVCAACGGEAWPCHRAELAEHNLALCQPTPSPIPDKPAPASSHADS